MRRPLILAATVAALATPSAAQAQGSGDDETATLSGRAYVFNHMDTFIEGATIRVREDKKLTAVTDANGDYELEVPVDTTVVPHRQAASRKASRRTCRPH